MFELWAKTQQRQVHLIQQLAHSAKLSELAMLWSLLRHGHGMPCATLVLQTHVRALSGLCSNVQAAPAPRLKHTRAGVAAAREPDVE